MRAPRVTFAAALIAITLGVVACGSDGDQETTGQTGGQSKGKITVGAFGFGESSILASMYEQVLDKAGYDASVKKLTNREVVEPALEKGDLDVVPEYVGTLTEFLNKKVNKKPGGADPAPLASGDLAATVEALRRLAEPLKLTVLTPSRAADQNAFAVTKDFATRHNLTKLSDLAGFNGPLVLGGPPECPQRPFCRPGLEKTYGIKFTGFKSLDAGGPLTKQAIKRGQVQVGLVFSSDGGIDALGLQVLEDDKGLQTVDNVVPVVRTEVLSDDLRNALNKVSETLTTEDLIRLNKRVDIERADPARVAEDYLREKGLL